MRMNTRNKCLGEEEAFKRFDEHFDLDVFALELEYGGRLGEAINQAVCAKSDRRQAAFDKMLAEHPATRVENARRAKARRLEAERLQRIAARNEAREKRQLQEGLQHLARRWRAQFIQKSPA